MIITIKEKYYSSLRSINLLNSESWCGFNVILVAGYQHQTRGRMQVAEICKGGQVVKLLKPHLHLANIRFLIKRIDRQSSL